MLQTTVINARLADAAALLVRVLPGRASAHPGVLLTADGDAVELAASDGELTARVRVPAVVHQAGEALVSRRGLAATLAALDAPEARLAVEGSRLAVCTANARFAMPQLDRAIFAPLADPPPVVGSIDGRVLRAASVPVAGAASQRDALPIFTGVRLRSRGDGLEMVATDRFRMASAAPAWMPAQTGTVDVLIPASFLAEVARQAGAASTVAVHADEGRLGFSWAGVSLVGAALGQPFPDAQIALLLAVQATRFCGRPRGAASTGRYPSNAFLAPGRRGHLQAALPRGPDATTR